MTKALLHQVYNDNTKNNYYLSIKPTDIFVTKTGSLMFTSPAITEPEIEISDLAMYGDDVVYCPPEILFASDGCSAEKISAWSLGVTLLKLYDVDLSDYASNLKEHQRNVQKYNSLCASDDLEEAIASQKEILLEHMNTIESKAKGLAKLLDDKEIPKEVVIIIKSLLEVAPENVRPFLTLF